MPGMEPFSTINSYIRYSGKIQDIGQVGFCKICRFRRPFAVYTSCRNGNMYLSSLLPGLQFLLVPTSLVIVLYKRIAWDKDSLRFSHKFCMIWQTGAGFEA